MDLVNPSDIAGAGLTKVLNCSRCVTGLDSILGVCCGCQFHREGQTGPTIGQTGYSAAARKSVETLLRRSARTPQVVGDNRGGINCRDGDCHGIFLD